MWRFSYVHDLQIQFHVKLSAEIVVDTVDHHIQDNRCEWALSPDEGRVRRSLTTETDGGNVLVQSLHDCGIFDQDLQGGEGKVCIESGPCRAVCMLIKIRGERKELGKARGRLLVLYFRRNKIYAEDLVCQCEIIHGYENRSFRGRSRKVSLC